MVEKVLRGYYGPLPKQAVPKSELLRAHFATLWASILGRHMVGLIPPRRPDVADLEAFAVCAAGARFPIWQPESLPAGFKVVGVEPPVASRDAVALRLGDERNRSFVIAQRASWLPLVEELPLAGVPFSRVMGVSPAIFVVHGKYGGEPIDHSFWGSRRAVMFEREGLLIELREVIGQGPGLSTLVHFARLGLPSVSRHREWHHA